MHYTDDNTRADLIDLGFFNLTATSERERKKRTKLGGGRYLDSFFLPTTLTKFFLLKWERGDYPYIVLKQYKVLFWFPSHQCQEECLCTECYQKLQ